MEEYINQLVLILQYGYLSVLAFKFAYELAHIYALYKIFPKLNIKRYRGLIVGFNDLILYEKVWKKQYGICYIVFNILAIIFYGSIWYLNCFSTAYKIAAVILWLSLLYLIIATVLNIICTIKLVNKFKCNCFIKIIIVIFNPLSLLILNNKKIELEK